MGLESHFALVVLLLIFLLLLRQVLSIQSCLENVFVLQIKRVLLLIVISSLNILLGLNLVLIEIRSLQLLDPLLNRYSSIVRFLHDPLCSYRSLVYLRNDFLSLLRNDYR